MTEHRGAPASSAATSPALAEAAAVVGLRPDPEPRDARRQHVQRLARGRHGAGAPRPRRGSSSRPGRRATRRIPLDDFFVRSGVTTLAPRELVDGDRAADPGVARRERPRAPDAPARPRPRVGDGGLRRGRGRRDAARVRQPRAAAAAASSTRPARSRTRRATDEPSMPCSRRCSPTRRPSRDVDARQPRVPARDAPRPRRGGRWTHGARRGSTSGRAMPTDVADRRSPSTAPRAIVAVEPHHTLLDVLRDDLGLTGTKSAASSASAARARCSLDGRSVDACLVLAVEADGAEVVTVEGLAPADGALSRAPARVPRARAPSSAASASRASSMAAAGAARRDARTRATPRSRRASPATSAAAACYEQIFEAVRGDGAASGTSTRRRQRRRCRRRPSTRASPVTAPGRSASRPPASAGSGASPASSVRRRPPRRRAPREARHRSTSRGRGSSASTRRPPSRCPASASS